MGQLQRHLRLWTPESIAVLYLVVSALWILFSDLILLSLFVTPKTLTDLQTVKGLGFITLTASLLYVLIRKRVRQLEAQEAQERALRETLEERAATLDAVIESLPEAVFIGTEERVNRANRRALEMIGRETLPDGGVTPADLGQTAHVRDASSGAPLSPDEAPYYRALEGTSTTRELIISTSDGHRYIRTAAAPIRRDDETIGAVSIISDITERKQQELALRKSQHNLTEAQRIANLGSWEGDMSSDLLYWSDEVYRIFGVSQDIFTPTIDAFFDLVHPDDRERVREARRQSLKDGSFDIQHRIRRPDGTVRTVHEHGVVTFDENGRATHIVGTVQDITERKQLEEALRTSERQYRLLFFNNPMPMWIYDLETHRFLEVNEAAVEEYGYGRDEFLAMTLFDLHRPEKHAALRENLRQDRPTLEHAGSWTHLRKDGSTLEADIVSHTLTFQEHEAVLVLARNVTQRNRIARENQQFSQALQMLLTVSRELVRELDLSRLFDRITRATVRTLPHAEAAALWLCDEDRNVIAPRAWHRHTGDLMETLQFPITDDVISNLLNRNAPYVADDVASDPRFGDLLDRLLPAHPGDSSLHRIRSAVVVPLQVEGTAIGLLTTESLSQPHVFSDKDVRLLQSLAAQASIAIQNGRLFQEVRTMSLRLFDVQETERRHIAQELHDEVGGLLTSLVLSLQMNPATSPEARAALDESRELVNSLISQVRQLSLDLRPSTLDDLGLLPALEEYIRRFQRRTQIAVTFQADLDEAQRFASQVETAAYRIVQEALTNVARHADTDAAWVYVRAPDGSLEIVVQDEGPGFDPEALSDDSMGLSGMEERAALLGGTLEIDARPGSGTTVTAHLPLEPALVSA